MQIYTSSQIRSWDTYTIEHEPILSIDLMERAAMAMTKEITARYGRDRSVVVFAGPGNNGGDALSVARQLAEAGYAVDVFLFNISNVLSDDCAANRERLIACGAVRSFTEVVSNFVPPTLTAEMVVIDGLFGSGTSRALSGGFAALVRLVNASPSTVVSIDLPSGLMSEDNTSNNKSHIIRADLTLTLGMKKLVMYLADCEQYVGEVVVLDIGLSQEYVERTRSIYTVVEEDYVRCLLRRRSPFAHKGNMGHCLLIAGAKGMCGAAILASRASLRSGAGKVTVLTPRCNTVILQMSVPEAIVKQDNNDDYFCEAIAVDGFNAIGIGSGIGTDESTAMALLSQLQRVTTPVVLDADAINLLASHRPWISQLPKHLILTPHAKEFDRLAGGVVNGSYDRLSQALAMAQRLSAYIVLKGHYTAVCCPDGDVFFNPTGNAGMATAGAGDVLTGIITALVGRGYSPRDACLVGVYVHGLAGDLAAAALGEESVIASDLIAYLPAAFKQLYDNHN